MAANAARGEVEVDVGGKPYKLVATLGALAEIESQLGIETIDKLNEALNQPSVKKVITILTALLRAGSGDEGAAFAKEFTVGEATDLISRAFTVGGLTDEKKEEPTPAPAGT